MLLVLSAFRIGDPYDITKREKKLLASLGSSERPVCDFEDYPQSRERLGKSISKDRGALMLTSGSMSSKVAPGASSIVSVSGVDPSASVASTYAHGFNTNVDIRHCQTDAP